MKHIYLCIALGIGSLGSVYGQIGPDTTPSSDRQEKIHYTLILPEEKNPELVKPNENNPFAKSDGKKIDEDQTSSEENTVRDALTAMSITGIGMTAEGRISCLLGSWKLEQGDYVPKVLNGQTVRLKVNSITPNSLDLVWVEAKQRTGQPPRVLSLPINVTNPTVRYLLGSPAPEVKTNAAKEKQHAFLTQDSTNGTLPKAPVEARKGIPVEDDAPIAESPEIKTTPPPSVSPLGGALLQLLGGGRTSTPTSQTPSANPPVPEPPPATKK